MSTGSYGRPETGDWGVKLGPGTMMVGWMGGGLGRGVGERGGQTKIGGCGGGGNIIGGGGSGAWKLYRLSGEGVIDLGLYDGLRLGQRHGLGVRLRLRLREGLTYE